MPGQSAAGSSGGARSSWHLRRGGSRAAWSCRLLTSPGCPKASSNGSSSLIPTVLPGFARSRCSSLATEGRIHANRWWSFSRSRCLTPRPLMSRHTWRLHMHTLGSRHLECRIGGKQGQPLAPRQDGYSRGQFICTWSVCKAVKWDFRVVFCKAKQTFQIIVVWGG